MRIAGLISLFIVPGLLIACSEVPQRKGLGKVEQTITPAPPPGLIPIDKDGYYKELKGKRAKDKLDADTAHFIATQAGMAAASLPSSGGPVTGVGDVRPIYADGWRWFTLRYISGNAEIWVANDLSYDTTMCAEEPENPLPPHDPPTQAQIDYLGEQLNSTIYTSNTTYFGLTNDRDGTGGSFATDCPLDDMKEQLEDDGLGSEYDCSWYQTGNPQRIMALVFNIVDEGNCDPNVEFYVAGYFWPTMNDEMADRNIIHIDTYDWNNRVGPDVAQPYLYEGTFAHEYEHAIHADHDPDETSWVDEGMADLSGFLAGYGHSAGHLAYYLVFHRTPLTIWGQNLEDYGASYLFQLYLMENFGGPDFIKSLVDEQANGIEGIENQLAAYSYSTTFKDIYRDWTLANYLDAPKLQGISGAQLGYDNLNIPSADTWGYSIQWSIKNYYGSDNQGNLPLPRYWGGYKSKTVQWPNGEVAPYAPMYLTYLGMQPQMNSEFLGRSIVGVAAHGGEYELFGGRGDLMFNTATSAPMTLGDNGQLSFWTWYEIEKDWDFGFVQVSTDGGATWTSLANDSTTYDIACSKYDADGNCDAPDAHPAVIANLPGFSGSSDGWVPQVFDLSAYAGEEIMIRFAYVTDWGYTEAGFYVDDVVVSDSTGDLLADDLEGGAGNWTLDGWERTTGLFTSDWGLSFINPIYKKGKFHHYQISEGSFFPWGPYQVNLTTLNTIALDQGEVTVVVNNRLPEQSSATAFYQLLVSKGTAKP